MCLKPGRLLSKSRAKEDREPEGADNYENDDQSDRDRRAKKGKKRKEDNDTPIYTSVPSNHVKKATKSQKIYARRLAETEAKAAAEEWPVLVPCSGRCPNYVHLACVLSEDVWNGEEDMSEIPKVLCQLCEAGLRQCCVCLVSFL